MDISFIILNYKSERYLAGCVASIEKNVLDLECEIIIINNDAEPLQNNWGIENIRIINNGLNVGFSIACNKAASVASGRILFFLNPDTEIMTVSISRLISKLEDESVGIVAPQLILPNGEIQPWSTGDEISLLTLLKNKSASVSLLAPRKLPLETEDDGLEVAWVSGAAFAIKKSTFEQIRGFDENFFMYFEDVDLCKRVSEIGKKIITFPYMKVLHIGGQSFSSTKKQKDMYYKSQNYYFKKHFGTLHLYALKILRRVSLIFKV